MVSINVPVIETRPCSDGYFVFAAAAAIGAEPRPASFEKIPLATPLCIASIIVEPAKPPTAAEPVNASFIINLIASGTAVMFAKIIKTEQAI